MIHATIPSILPIPDPSPSAPRVRPARGTKGSLIQRRAGGGAVGAAGLRGGGDGHQKKALGLKEKLDHVPPCGRHGAYQPFLVVGIYEVAFQASSACQYRDETLQQILFAQNMSQSFRVKPKKSFD